MDLPVIPNRPLNSLGDTVEARSPGGRFPWAGQWELTCRCNLRCVMCYTDCCNTPGQIRKELSTPEILRILDELQEAGCMELTFTGGEALARPDFMEIYDAAHRRGFFLTIFTNGTLITEQIADHWAEARPKTVEISLHGFSAKVFEAVTQVPGSLPKCLRAIELMVARKIPLVLKTVGMTVNREEILAIKRYANQLGAGVTWRFGEYMRDDLVESGSPLQFQLPEEELRATEQQDPELWEAKCRDITKSESITKSEPMNQTCKGGRNSFHIDAYGQLQLCSNNRLGSYDLRTGSFKHGFYEVLPTLPCSGRVASPSFHPAPLQEARRHAGEANNPLEGASSC